MLNVVDGAGRQIVYYRNLVAALQICISKMRTDEAGAAGYEYTQIIALLYSVNSWTILSLAH